MTGTEVALAAAIAGSAMSAMGSMQQGKAAQQAANFNAQVAQNNAIAARQAAAENARRGRRAAAKRTGAIRARINTDTSMDLLEDSVMEEELNINSILHAGELQALGLEANASLERTRGVNARRAGNVQAASSLLSGAAKAADKFGSSGSDFSYNLDNAGEVTP